MVLEIEADNRMAWRSRSNSKLAAIGREIKIPSLEWADCTSLIHPNLSERRICNYHAYSHQFNVSVELLGVNIQSHPFPVDLRLRQKEHFRRKMPTSENPFQVRVMARCLPV